MVTLPAWTPPDGGWGWVIAVVSLLVHGQTLGMMLAMSVMYVSWLEEFGDSRGATSWVLSIGTAVMSGLGPLPAALANRCGFRVLVIIAGLLTSAGYILSYFATSVSFLIVTVGFIAGLGGCFGFLSSVAIISIYFDKRRSIAMGIGTSGVGIGALIAAPLLNFLTDSYGWRGALLIIGGASLNICAYGLLIRPVQQVYRIEEEIEIDAVDQYTRHGDQPLLENEDSQSYKEYYLQSATKLYDDCYEGESSQSIEQTPIPQVTVSSIDPIGTWTESRLSNQEKESQLSRSRLSIPLRINPRLKNQPFCSLGDLSHNKTNCSGSYIMPLHINWKNSMNAIFVMSVNQVDRISLLETPRNFQQNVNCSENETAITSNQSNNINSPPPIRRATAMKSMTFLWPRFVKSLKVLLLTNVELLKDPMFLLFVISNIVTNLSYITPAMYLVDRAVDAGLDKTVGAMLVAFNGTGNICGRLIFGFATYRLFSDRLLVYIVVLSVGGLFTMFSPLCGTNAVLHCIYAFLIGCCIGGYGTLVAVVTVDIMGMSKASESFGLLMSFMGIAVLVGTPFGGVLFDWTQGYTSTYIVFGFFLIGSVLILMPAAFKRRIRMKNEAKMATGGDQQ